MIGYPNIFSFVGTENSNKEVLEKCLTEPESFRNRPIQRMKLTYLDIYSDSLNKDTVIGIT